MKSPLLTLLCLFLTPPVFGQVIISELYSNTNDRIFTRDAQGVARLGGGIQWWEAEFNDSNWNTGTTPIGFGYGDIATNVQSAVQNITPTLYLRHEFTLTGGQASSGQTLELTMDYDDSFIAYLNGKEIARMDAAAPGSPHYHDQVSYNSNSANGTGTTISIGVANQFLQTGTNVLAIEIHNDQVSSGTLKAKATLRTSSTTYVNSGDSCAWFPGIISPSGGVFDYSLAGAGASLTAPWGTPEYDDSSWAAGPGPIGYETSSSGQYALGTNLSGMRNNYWSVYMRTSFNLTASQLAAITQLEFTVDYDDGYIAYLNGQEVSRGNMGAPGTPYPFDSGSEGGHNATTDGGGTFAAPTITIDASALRVGENILAGQLHNSGLSSSDLILYMELGDGTSTLVPSNATYSYHIGSSEPAGGGATAVEGELAFSDWIELHNIGSTSVDLTDWKLSDDSAAPDKWTFPTGTTIPAGGYLLILADDQEELNSPGNTIHAGFNLSASGEEIILTDSSFNTVSIPGGFPSQYPTHSFGWDPNSSTWAYFDTPTPGHENTGAVLSDRVDAPDFSPLGGFYDSTQTLTLTSNTPGATIRYTQDGSEPTETNGIIYTAPLSLTTINNNTGHVIRARAFKPGLITSKSKTHTYLIGQDSRLKAAPALIFSGEEGEIFFKPHGIMAIEGGTYSNSQWQENGPSSYNIPLMRGQQYERPLRLEFYHNDATPGFREDAGVRLSSSGYSRPRLILNNTSASPWTSAPEHKPSFNLYFRDDYGPASLDYPFLGQQYPATKFEQLRIRAGKNDISNPFIVDEVVRRLFDQMGQESSVGIINSLYINGSFKGFYNMCERLREPFMQTHHNSNEKWDVRQVNDYANGDISAWNTMMGILNRNGNSDLSQSDWEDALAYLDPVNMADYFLLNIYGATWDWPQNNWVGARERTPEGKYRLYVWDAEGSYQGQGYFNPVNHNTFSSDLLSKNDTLSQLFQRLIKAPEWRLIFADRVNKHLFNNGVLDDRLGNNSTFGQTTLQVRDEFQPLYNFVHGGNVNLNFLSNWTSSSSGRRRYLFGPSRTDFADNNLWPSVAPVNFSQHGGDAPMNYSLSMTSPNGGTIYFTLDGSDPRQLGGNVATTAQSYSSPATLTQGTITVKSRARNGSTWSALTEATFSVELTDPSPSNLVISEFLYHPPAPTAAELAAGFNDQDDFEFIELLNTSPTNVIALDELIFSGAMNFDFSTSSKTELAPGERIILASNSAAFSLRYGNRLALIGEYSGTLSNSMETITLSRGGASPLTIRNFTYLDDAPWPVCADGPGHSLILLNPNSNPDHATPSNWTCSTHFGGYLNNQPLVFDYAAWTEHNFTPAQITAAGAYDADPDRDGLTNYHEFIFGSSPLANSSVTYPFSSVTQIGEEQYPTLHFQRSPFDLPVITIVETSDNLSTWTPVNPTDVTILPAILNPDQSRSETYRVDIPFSARQHKFYRLKFSPQP
ncbi:MAG: lamin tail domain-containing protein [Verrucomicrobiaceae bacterium]